MDGRVWISLYHSESFALDTCPMDKLLDGMVMCIGHLHANLHNNSTILQSYLQLMSAPFPYLCIVVCFVLVIGAIQTGMAGYVLWV